MTIRELKLLYRWKIEIVKTSSVSKNPKKLGNQNLQFSKFPNLNSLEKNDNQI